MIEWDKRSRLCRFVAQSEIADDVQRCHNAIDNFLSNFNLASHTEILKSLEKIELNRQRDKEELRNQLSEIDQKEELTSQIANGISHKVDKMDTMLGGFMSVMQEVNIYAFSM